MRVTWKQAVEAAAHCGFLHAVLLPARRLAEYRPNAEAERSRITENPFSMLDGVQSVMVCALPFVWHSQWPKDSAEVSAYYFHSQRAHEAIGRLCNWLCDHGVTVADGRRLPAKLLGKEAGLGVIGRNCLLRNDLWGSCFALRVLVTDIPPQPDRQPLPASTCGACMRCVCACPTGALTGDGTLYTSRCLRAHMLRGTVVPRELRAGMETRLLGCEICQRVCPANASIPCVAPDADAYAIAALLQGSGDTLDRIAKQIGGNEARKQRLQAQAALAAGNAADARYLEPLRELATHDRPAIAVHAQWAIEKIEWRDSYAEA